jgi:23S rRNA (uracil1939-C5)-methyltransferase
VADPVVRIAARGDGVTASGQFVPWGVPGDLLLEDGSLQHGPHHQAPPCRHFPECGGCQLQHADDMAYGGYLADRIAGVLSQHGLTADILAPHLSPPCSRRRASLRALRSGRKVVFGFNAERSNRVIDMRECHILRPELFRLVQPLRDLLSRLPLRGSTAEVQLTLVDGGADLLLRGVERPDLQATEALVDFATRQGLARMSIDSGLGPETMFEPQPATITLSGSKVAFPPGAFLQATADGEAALVDSVRTALPDAGPVADLFAGLGTFALALRQCAYAAEGGRDLAGALCAAKPGATVEHRDLFRRPLDASELKRFAGVVLDPPRAGALEQAAQLARSAVGRTAYVSCNPATFARDARLLVDGGFKLEWVRPVGQFRWSTHVELAAAFAR